MRVLSNVALAVVQRYVEGAMGFDVGSVAVSKPQGV